MNDKITITAEEYGKLLRYQSAFNSLMCEIVHQSLIKKPSLEKIIASYEENPSFKDLMESIRAEEEAYLIKCEQMGLL
jgi:predicted CopG family antitoxin